MRYLDKYIEKIRARGDDSLADHVKGTAHRIGGSYLEQFDFVSHDKGITLDSEHDNSMEQVCGTICHAADLGFPLFVFLTENRVVLYEQTLQRIKSEMEDFCVCGENDCRFFEKNNLEEPAVVVMKKNYRVLKLWDMVLNSTEYLKEIPIVVVEHETIRNHEKISFTGKYLSSIKNGAASSISLQVAG